MSFFGMSTINSSGQGGNADRYAHATPSAYIAACYPPARAEAKRARRKRTAQMRVHDAQRDAAVYEAAHIPRRYAIHPACPKSAQMRRDAATRHV